MAPKREIKITLPIEQARILEEQLLEKFGTSHADAVGKIFTLWLVEKGYIKLPREKNARK